MMRHILVWLFLTFTPVHAQVLHHHEGLSPDVDKFYSYWLQPNGGKERYYGCCNRIDCYPTEAKIVNGHWWYRHRETWQWLPVPDEKVEHLQPDPRESPDGRNHVCATTLGWVYCFVAGASG